MIRLLILLVALSFGGLTSWFAFDRLPSVIAAQGPQDGGAMPVQMIEVLVAQQEITGGTRLTPGALMWQQWPETAIDPDVMITRPAFASAVTDLSGSLARSRIIRGEPIQRSKLAAADSGFLAAILPHGKRAVSMRISAENSAGGFILPNDHVDVVFTRARTGVEGNELFARSYTIARNLRVVAIDQTVSDDSAGVTVIGKTATLEVDPEQAEIITAAQAAGTLSLSLRPAQDSGALAEDKPILLADLLLGGATTDMEPPDGDSTAPLAAAEPTASPGATAMPVRIISKGGIEVVTPPVRDDT